MKPNHITFRHWCFDDQGDDHDATIHATIGASGYDATIDRVMRDDGVDMLDQLDDDEIERLEEKAIEEDVEQALDRRWHAQYRDGMERGLM